MQYTSSRLRYIDDAPYTTLARQSSGLQTLTVTAKRFLAIPRSKAGAVARENSR